VDCAATRNALVHCAGHADREFVNLVEKHPSLKEIKIGAPILLEGTLVRDLVNSTNEKGVELLQFADAWLRKNKE
jgi:hypothetical protein